MKTSPYFSAKQASTDNSVNWQDDTISAADATGPDFASCSVVFAPSILMPSAVPVAQSLYLTEAGDSTAISINDIHQGQIGDCFLLSSFGEVALFHPDAITNMIHDNGNGTESVTLYIDRNGRLPGYYSTSFKSTTVTVRNSFYKYSVNNGAATDVVGNVKEIWPQVVEQAVATLGGGIGSIANGGSPVVAMEELTGQSATSMSPANLTFAALTKSIAAGDLIVMDTSWKSRLPYNLVSSHAYMFEKLIGSGGAATVQLHNPWGSDQPAAIPLSQLTQAGIVEVDIGHAR